MKEARDLCILIILTIVTVIFMCFQNAKADYSQSRFNYTWDSDSVRTTEFLTGYAWDLEEHPWILGFLQGIREVKSNDGSATYHETLMTFEGKPSPVLTISGTMGSAYKSSRSEILGNSLISYNPDGPWYMELSYERNIVETIRALDKGVMADMLFLSADYQFNDNWTIVGVLGATKYSDGNKKLTQGGHLIYNVTQIPGLYFKGTTKFDQSDDNPPEYFAPLDKVQYLFGPGYNHYFKNIDLVLRASYQFGKQNINNYEWEDADLLKIRIIKPIAGKARLEATYVYTTDGGEADYQWEGLYFILKIDF